MQKPRCGVDAGRSAARQPRVFERARDATARGHNGCELGGNVLASLEPMGHGMGEIIHSRACQSLRIPDVEGFGQARPASLRYAAGRPLTARARSTSTVARQDAHRATARHPPLAGRGRLSGGAGRRGQDGDDLADAEGDLTSIIKVIRWKTALGSGLSLEHVDRWQADVCVSSPHCEPFADTALSGDQSHSEG